jgi:hypothetical protein
MPSPLYIICSESGADDRISGQSSLFNIIERINFFKLPPGVAVIGGMNMRITAAWRREEGDAGKGFDFQSGVWSPDDELHILGSGEFVFEHPTQKIGARIAGSLPVTKSGVLRAFVRIRPTGGEAAAWQTQQYPIDIVEAEMPQSGTVPPVPNG